MSVDIDDARRILGVDEHMSLDEVRTAFRRGLRDHHPDLHGSAGDAAADTREFIAAYRLAASVWGVEVASRSEPEGPAPEDVTSVAEAVRHEESVARRIDDQPTLQRSHGPDVWTIGRDTIALGCPADEAYPLLVEVAHQVGDVTHVDRSEFEFLEFLVRSTAGDTISVVCSLQGRSNGSTEAFFTLEPLDVARGPLPDVGDVVSAFISRLPV